MTTRPEVLFRRMPAIRLAAMVIEALTASDAGSGQAARDVYRELGFVLETLRIIEDPQPGDPVPIIVSVERALAALDEVGR